MGEIWKNKKTNWKKQEETEKLKKKNMNKRYWKILKKTEETEIKYQKVPKSIESTKKFQDLPGSTKKYKKHRAPVPSEARPGGTDSPHFCMGPDCLWDSKEQHRKWTA